MPDWNPSQYERFKAQRSHPFFDLMGMLESSTSPNLVDLGCGTGELTQTLHRTLKAAKTVGIDNSPAMLERAKTFEEAGLTFETGTLEAFAADHAYDVIFSNAALHWCPDHPELFERLSKALKPGGQLAVQVPANFDHPSHWLAKDIFDGEGFRSEANPPVTGDVLSPRQYAELLFKLGFEAQRVELRVYGHVLENTESVVEWTRGTTLTAYEKVLSPPRVPGFIQRDRDRRRSELGRSTPYFYGFNRILLWARQGLVR
jgi:trans-aconitate 2-methyltransferase